MIGASSNPTKPSHGILRARRPGRVIPVNPRETEILGERAYPSLLDVAEPVDIVDVFRRPEDTPSIADEAITKGAKALWLQDGIVNEEAAARAAAAGLTVVMDACISATRGRLLGRLIYKCKFTIVNYGVSQSAASSCDTSASSCATTARIGSGLLRSTPARCSSVIGWSLPPASRRVT